MSLDERNGRGRRKTGDAADQSQQSGVALRADEATAFLKALSHEGRLRILCHLSEGERSVTELERILGTRQAAVSQQLARLRLEGLVNARRDGKAIYYSIADARVGKMIAVVHDMFCAPS